MPKTTKKFDVGRATKRLMSAAQPKKLQREATGEQPVPKLCFFSTVFYTWSLTIVENGPYRRFWLYKAEISYRGIICQPRFLDFCFKFDTSTTGPSSCPGESPRDESRSKSRFQLASPRGREPRLEKIERPTCRTLFQSPACLLGPGARGCLNHA